MSRNDERAPVAQKNLSGESMPKEAPLARSRMSAGIIVMKMPMNSLATSAMGAHSKLLRERSSVEVVSHDRIIARQMSEIWATYSRPMCAPKTSTPKVLPVSASTNAPSCGMSPLRMTPTIMMSRKKRLCQPCRWMGTRSSARVSNSS